jgi:hypothetical protein
MADIILKAIKPALSDLLDKLKAQAPAAIDALIAWLITVLPGSVDKLTAAFRTLYSDITTRLVAWLPSTKAPLVATIDKAVGFIKTKVLAKL